jgi:hypothetical protein
LHQSDQIFHRELDVHHEKKTMVENLMDVMKRDVMKRDDRLKDGPMRGGRYCYVDALPFLHSDLFD